MALSIFNRRKEDGVTEMTFIDHLDALRWHIMRSLIAVLAVSIAIFINIDWVFDRIIMGPVSADFITYTGFCRLGHWLHMGDSLCMPYPENFKLQGNTVSGPFMSAFSISFTGGFIFSFPYIFWEFWRFVKPALKPKELKAAQGGIVWASLCFFLGALFGYFILMPFTISFLANFKLGTAGFYTYIPTLGDYIDNLVNILLGCAIAFELPIMAYVLTKIGIVTPKFLRTYRKYAYVAILVIAAIITPSPDWGSQMIVTLPLVILYEISITLSTRVVKKQEQKAKEWS